MTYNKDTNKEGIKKGDKNMEKIYYKNDEYTKMYEHENGGTYYVSNTSEIVTSWLDVYPNGTVKYLWDGVLYDLGILVEDKVVEQ